MTDESLFIDPGATGGYVGSGEDAEKPGDRIGVFKLLQRIGEGGMGSVWMAEQTDPVRRMVALKVIKAGMDSKQVLARFEAERQALALMDHPNIAKVLDAGTTETGRPYFVMELVKGVPITTFCDEHQSTPRQRLKLFVAVCSAIQHAHTKGVIHRDVKPSNVLVAPYDDTPVVKVIDFGIAKATAGALTDATLFTQFGSIVGTLEYMSPEQAKLNALDIDTRSDVYSLGVLLYELLTGTTPFDRERLRTSALDECLRLIREEDPPRPSVRLSGATLPAAAQKRGTEPAKLAGLVRGELDWIAMKALEKDRTRRYESPAALARDVERHLAGEPVEACPPTWRYRAGKFVRKHRAAIVTASVFVLLLVAATAVSIGFALQAERERDRAQEAERLARQSLTFFTQELAALGPMQQPNPDLPLREFVQRLAIRVDRASGKDDVPPLVEASSRRIVGKWLDELGDYPEAERHLRRASTIFAAELGERMKETIACDLDLATALSQQIDLKKVKEAIDLFRRTRTAAQESLGEDDPITLSTTSHLAWAQSRSANYEGDETKAKEALRLVEDTHARHERLDRPRDIGRLMNAALLVQLLTEQWAGDAATLGRCELLIAGGRSLARREFGEGSYIDNLFRFEMANIRGLQGRFEEALAEYDAFAPLVEANLGPNHRLTQEAQSCRLYYAMVVGKHDRLEELLRDLRIGALRDAVLSLAAFAPTQAEALVLVRKGDDRAAEAKLRDSIRELRKKDNKFVGAAIAFTQMTLAVVFIQAGRADEAVPVLADALKNYEAVPRPTFPYVMAATFGHYAGMVARAYEQAGLQAGAEEWQERARKARETRP